jgi:hypothetical protein
MSRTLLDITDDFQALDELLAEAGGDITEPSVQRYIEQLIDQLDQDFLTKVDNYAALISELEARAQHRKDEAKRLDALAKSDANSATFLKQRLKTVLEQRGTKKLETPRYRLSVAGNGGKLPVEIHVDASDLPEQYQKVKRDPDTDAIREALQKGEEVQGCALGERGKHLRIN